MSQSTLKLSVARNMTSAGKRAAFEADDAFMTVAAANTSESPITILQVYLQVSRKWWDRLRNRWRIIALAANPPLAVYPHVVEAGKQWRALWPEDVVNAVCGPWPHSYLCLRTDAKTQPSIIRLHHEPPRVKAGSG